MEPLKKLPVRFFDDLCADTGISEAELARIIRVPDTVSGLRENRECFSLQESRRLIRIRRIYDTALAALGDAAAARDWLAAPYWLLKQARPVDHLKTEDGCREIETILDLMKKGMFSFSLPA